MNDGADEKAYVLVRMLAEMGEYHYTYWLQNSEWPQTKPSTQEMVDEVLHYITPDVLPLTPEESAQVAQYAIDHPDKEGQLPPELRRGDVVFRSKTHLIEGLNSIAPGTAEKIKGTAGADTDGWGIEAWTVSLGLGGALVLIGRLAIVTKFTPTGALVSVIAGVLLITATAVFGANMKTKEGKNIVAAGVEKLGDVINAVGAAGKSLITGLVTAAVVGVGIGVTVWAIRRSKPRQQLKGAEL